MWRRTTAAFAMATWSAAVGSKAVGPASTRPNSAASAMRPPQSARQFRSLARRLGARQRPRSQVQLDPAHGRLRPGAVHWRFAHRAPPPWRSRRRPAVASRLRQHARIHARRLGQWVHVAVTYDATARRRTMWTAGRCEAGDRVEHPCHRRAEIGNWNPGTRRVRRRSELQRPIDELSVYDRALQRKRDRRAASEWRGMGWSANPFEGMALLTSQASRGVSDRVWRHDDFHVRRRGRWTSPGRFPPVAHAPGSPGWL